MLSKVMNVSFEANSLSAASENRIRTNGGIEAFRREFRSKTIQGVDPFLQEMKQYLDQFSRIHVAEFEIVGIKQIANTPLTVRIDIRYDLVGTLRSGSSEERIGHWLTQWSNQDVDGWKASKWQATQETVTRAREPLFVDITSEAVGQIKSYRDQFSHGVDHWRTVIDGACGIDIYGNNGVAAGDFDNDGFDDLYVCQPAGLPNRLYRNRGDGTFEDVTEKAGVGVLDATACALFADFENKGLQDLLVVCAGGPLLFLNQGKGKFLRKRDAFHFEQPPQGTFTHAALADYDGDGRLDIYFCLYSYYLGLDQYHYPAPYFDARNGPPNFLFHNEGNATFRDRTEAAGLNVENDRYSFACAWGDYNSDGRQDLYVANDFGRSNLYRNNGEGTFTAVSAQAGVEDPGAGMSACWLDAENNGKPSLYVSNMWSSAGIRVAEQKIFQQKDSEEIRGYYRRHAQGNSFYRNLGNGKFQNVTGPSGAELGRWAWSSDSWDFDHDGYADLYVANGYISGPISADGKKTDLASFFWRQVVGNSPPDASASPGYEQGWSAINELIRSDSTWNGYERNVLFSNNRDGTFTDVSGISGLDLREDSRSFALADLDHDGRLEVIVKSRNAPQLRILHNAMKELGHSIAFRLRGQKSNRDAIGAAVTVEGGALWQTKFLQAGTGFLSQHSKELFFGVGQSGGNIRASVRWPSGVTQSFDSVPVNHRIELTEGIDTFRAVKFATTSASLTPAVPPPKLDNLPESVETWLLDPLFAPDFSLPDVSGKLRNLASLHDDFLLLHFCSTALSSSVEQLRLLERDARVLSAQGLSIAALNVDDTADSQKVQALVNKEMLSYLVLLATPEVVGIYNTVYRYLFDRRRDLGIPTSFLIDKAGVIVKLYQGFVSTTRVLRDMKEVPTTPAQRFQKALPFEGNVHQSEFQRNEFTYGVAFFQRGYLEQAEASFRQVIAGNPENPEAYYNLGTLYLRRNALSEARQNLEQTVKLRPDYPEAWNNLGMIAAQEGKPEDAIKNFQESLRQRPSYVTALLNLGNVYRRQENYPDSLKVLNRALELAPEDPEVNYNLGMLYARQEQLEKAAQFLQKAIDLRPSYVDALNNLGVLYVREGRSSDAEEKFQSCIRLNPNFDQAYLNLARLYMISNEKEKARDILQALLRLQPLHKLAQQALEMLH